tara:strand:- start:11805 stop:12671 length:867 start_codon:yes stop_codon:yes gene_type:complete
MYNILVTGANGQLGSEISALVVSYPQHHLFFTDVIELDITNKEAIERFVSKNKINIIINCAAYTAVDKAESEPELANIINHLAVQYMAEVAKLHCCKFIHISTDYVFDGTSYKPYLETDTPSPQSVYGITKLAGEQAMQAINPANSIIIRTSWVYAKYGNNFVKTMLRLGNEKEEISVVADQIGTPTNAADLAKAILTIVPQINNEVVEIFHYSNEGICSWYDLAKAIFEIEGVSLKVSPIETKQYPTPAERPFYSVLNKGRIKEKYQVEIPYWKDSLVRCLEIMGVK